MKFQHQYCLIMGMASVGGFTAPDLHKLQPVEKPSITMEATKGTTFLILVSRAASCLHILPVCPWLINLPFIRSLLVFIPKLVYARQPCASHRQDCLLLLSAVGAFRAVAG